MNRTPIFASFILLASLLPAAPATAQLALIDPPYLDFGSLTIGSASTLALTVTNGSVDDLVIYDVSIPSWENPFGAYAITAMDPINVPMSFGQSMSIEVTYTPPVAGLHLGRMILHTNDTFGAIHLVDLAGEAQAPVPEPAGAALWGLGLIAAALYSRRGRQSRCGVRSGRIARL